MDLEDKINRQVEFIQAPAFQSGVTTGVNNTWLYNRAPEGYLFELSKIEMSVNTDSGENGMLAIFDGHEYTHWNIWPGVESREYLARIETNVNNMHNTIYLDGWECKEYTIACRSRSASKGYKVCTIMWYHLKKMNKEMTLQYAVLQPKAEHFRKGGPTTLSESER